MWGLAHDTNVPKTKVALQSFHWEARVGDELVSLRNYALWLTEFTLQTPVTTPHLQ